MNNPRTTRPALQRRVELARLLLTASAPVSQQTLAQRLGVSQPTVSRYMRDVLGAPVNSGTV